MSSVSGSNQNDGNFNDTEINDVKKFDSREHCVAITNDISLKGQTNWFNGLDVLTDSDGCENKVDRDFAKYEL